MASNLRNRPKKPARARLDADGTAEPLTHFVGVNTAPKGACLSPDDAVPTALVDEGGARTPLAAQGTPPVPIVEVEPESKMYQIADFDGLRNRFTNYVLELERLAQEVEKHMTILRLVEKGDPSFGPSSLAYVRGQFQTRLDVIHKLSQVTRKP
jgi:hypothetical protein